MGAELFQPLWLCVLPLLAALLVAVRLPWWRAARRAGRPALRGEIRRLVLRLVWLALPVLALAGATLTRPLDRQAIVFVVDGSASVSASRDEAEDFVRTALESLAPGDLAGVVVAAAGARVEEAPDARPLFERVSVTLPTDATDLAAGLRLAGALVPEGHGGRVVLVSDGRETRGDAVAAARALRAQGVAVDVAPVGGAGADLRLETLALPERAYPGEVSTLSVRIVADRAGAATLRVYRDDALLAQRVLTLRVGRQEVAVPIAAGEPGLHRYRVDIAAASPTDDALGRNNALGAVQRVAGPPRVLVVAADPAAAGLLPAALASSGAEVSVAPPASLPGDLAGLARYAVTVLADVRAETLPAGSSELLEAYVRDLGRGLVMTGGADSLGPGGYADTPIERALPVYMDVRGRGREPKVALVLVIDKSGSMSGEKQELAKEAAARSIRLLRPDDRAAILAFDSVPQWVATLTPLTERESLERAIGSIYAGGGTEIYPAVAEGFAALESVGADVKHLIVLTDGHSGSGGDYAKLLEGLREARVTLSTVAVGPDADTALLQAMARAGRGRYHFAADPGAIPRIFAEETLLATRTILVDSHFYPAAASSSALLRSLAAVPPLDGYVATTPKEAAEVVLVSPEADPVLAAWQYGAGRSVVWTPDLTDRWAGGWVKGPAATTLWGNVLSWLLPTEESGDLAVRVEPAGDEGFEVVVESRTGWDEVRPTRAVVLGPDGSREEMTLPPAGPGRYRAPLAAQAVGAYVVQVTQPTESGGERRGEVGWAAPYPAEYREAGADLAFLHRLAAAGGGRMLGSAEEAMRPAERAAVARWPLAPLLLALAALAWPLEIAARRLTLPAARLRLAVPIQKWLGRSAPGAGPPGTQGAGVAVGEVGTQSDVTTTRLLERKRELRARRE